MRYFLPGLAVIAGLLCGCAGSRVREADLSAIAIRTAPAVLAALSGPDALLLTNLDGLQCRAAFVLSGLSGKPGRVSGLLLESHGRLCFESDGAGKAVSGRFGVIWDIAQNRGYLTSEDLQGVAPVSGTNHYGLLRREAEASTGAVQGGHPVQTSVVTLFTGDGQTIRRRVWEAADLKALALRIEPINDDGAPAISLSDIRTLNLPDNVFAPPEDFTKYPSAAALLNELVARQRSVYDRNDDFQGNLGPLKAPGEMRNQSPRAPQ